MRGWRDGQEAKNTVALAKAPAAVPVPTKQHIITCNFGSIVSDMHLSLRAPGTQVEHTLILW